MLRLPLKHPTFRGGVHPADNKEHTKYLEIEELAAPKTMVFPVSQHAGKPSVAVVKVGDSVKVGQLIAKQDGFISANIHSSVSGTVSAIEPRLHPCGRYIESVIVENDEKYKVCENIKPNKPIDELTKEEIVQIVSDAGIVGMGGAAFPTHVKLTCPSGKKISRVIINGAECEPYLTSDYRVMLEDTEQLLEGCKAVMKALDAPECIIAVESNKQDAIKTIQQNILYHNISTIKVVKVKTKYPQGSEKQLINAITGKEVPPGGLPSDVGVVVLNIDTCCAVSRAITAGMPLITRIVTVSGSAVTNKRNFRVRIGTPVEDVLKGAGGLKIQPAKILLGGPMMGMAIYSTDVPVIKGTGAVLALTDEDIGARAKTNCTRCGKCVDVCPMRLLPTIIDDYCIKFNADMLEKYNMSDCIECGACTYTCPAGKDPLQNIRVAKQKINALRKHGK